MAATHPTTGPVYLDLHMPNHWPAQTDLISWAQQMGPGEAAILIILGVVYLLFGINIYKIQVMVNGAILGAAIGSWLGEHGGNAQVGALVGGAVAAMIVFPMMKHAVAIMMAITGALVGASLWRLFSPHPDVYWVGGCCGAVILGMLSFQLFRGCIMTYTALQGATMVAGGVLALATKYNDLYPKLFDAMKSKPFILPIAIFLPALLGLIYQQTPSATAAAAAGAKKK